MLLRRSVSQSGMVISRAGPPGRPSVMAKSATRVRFSKLTRTATGTPSRNTVSMPSASRAYWRGRGAPFEFWMGSMLTPIRLRRRSS
ncbi:hypothetical protein D3C87_1884180 [compost metagenome]